MGLLCILEPQSTTFYHSQQYHNAFLPKTQERKSEKNSTYHTKKDLIFKVPHHIDLLFKASYKKMWFGYFLKKCYSFIAHLVNILK